MSDEHAVNIIEHLENIEVGVALTDNCIRFIGHEVQAAIQAERERCAKIAQKRANVLFELAGKESIEPLMIALKTGADELKRVADAIRRREGVC